MTTVKQAMIDLILACGPQSLSALKSEVKIQAQSNADVENILSTDIDFKRVEDEDSYTYRNYN